MVISREVEANERNNYPTSVVIITKWMGVYQRQLKPLSHLLLILFVETVK